MEDVAPFNQRDTDVLMQFATKYMQTQAPRKISESTRKHYQKTASLYFDRPEEALRTTSKGTYYARKAALIFVAAERMVAAINRLLKYRPLKSA